MSAQTKKHRLWWRRRRNDVTGAAVRIAIIASLCAISPPTAHAQSDEVLRVALLVANNTGSGARPSLRYAEDDAGGAADAAVVLGAAQWNGSPSPVFQAARRCGPSLVNSSYIISPRLYTSDAGIDRPLRLNRDEALAEARRLADADQPSTVTIDNGDGIILEEHLLGRDLSQEMEN